MQGFKLRNMVTQCLILIPYLGARGYPETPFSNGNDGGDCADLMSLPGFTKMPSDHLEGITKTTEESTCVFPPDTLQTWLGNGICDPALNNALCDWDGNDCHNHPSFSPYFGTQYSLLKV